jgi:predicted nucleic acid-binding protein
VLVALAESSAVALSTQVLSEFFVTVTRKIPTPLSPIEAAHRVDNYIASWIICHVTTPVVSEAVRGVLFHQLSYYDSLIWATAKLNQLTNILTEDGQHGRLIEGVRYWDPFDSEFRVADLQANT